MGAYRENTKTVRVPLEAAAALEHLAAETRVAAGVLLGKMIEYSITKVKKRPKEVIYEIYFDDEEGGGRG